MSTTGQWVETKDPKTGRSYYYNKATKQTQWNRPPEMDSPAGAGAPAAPTPSAPAAASPAAASSGSDNPDEVAANWAQGTDPKTGRAYYYNKVTKKTSWSKPACMDGVATPPTPPAAATTTTTTTTTASTTPSTSATPTPTATATPTTTSTTASTPTTTSTETPPEWKEAKDPSTGRSYWYNRVTKETTWKNPLENKAAAAAPPVPPAAAVPPPVPAAATTTTTTAPPPVPAAAAAAAPPTAGFRKMNLRDDDDDDVLLGRGEEAKADTSSSSSADKDDDQPRDIADLLRDDDSDDEDGGKKDKDRKTLQDDDENEEGHEFRFAKHRKGFFNRIFRVGKVFDESRLLTFKKSLIKKALLKQNRELDAEAVQTFKNIMSYMGDRSSSKPPIEHAKKMLRNLMIAPSGLRDEAYMQICKQTTGNPKIESTIKGWELLNFFLATFPPSKHLKSFLLNHVNKHCEDVTVNEKIRALARIALERLPTIITMGQRKQVPSTVELQCLQENKPIPIKICLANGTFRMLTVDPYTTVEKVEQMMHETFNIIFKTPFSLYEMSEETANVERILDKHDRVLDVVASWENKPLVEEVKVDEKKQKAKTYEKVPTQQLKLDKKEYKYTSLLYKAKLVLKTANPDLTSDAEAVNLIYLQAVQDVVTERYPCAEKDITVLGALQLQATFGDYKKDVHVPGWLKPKIDEFMPVRLLEKKPGKKSDNAVAEWEQKILAKYMKVSGFTALESKLNYLDYVQEWVYYGSTFFIVEQRQFKDYPSPLTLGINCEGVLLMHPEKKTVLENYAYTDIVTWGHSDEKFIVVVGNIVQQRKLIFKTSDGKAMNHLIHDYVKLKVKNKEVPGLQ